MIETNESMTAKLCSWARANHSLYGNIKIFDDFFAYRLMGHKEYKKTENIIKNSYSLNFINNYVCPIVLPRIAYAESRLCRFLNEYKNIQYVILGAGMDTFVLRNKNKNIDIFELDHPLTQKYKIKKIKNAGFEIPLNAYFIPIDFEIEDIQDVLYASGFNFNKPTFFSFLGVSYYLNLKSFENTISSISKVSNFKTELVFDFPDETLFKNNRTKYMSEITASMGEPMKEGFEYKRLKELLKKYNFKIENHFTPEKIRKTYLKDKNNTKKAFENIHFVSAIK